MKTLILKSRLPDQYGNPTWHDKTILGYAINHIAKGKDLMALSSWISVAGAIQEASDTADFGKLIEGGVNVDGNPIMVPNLPELQVEIKNSEARLLWKELSKLSWENFGGNIVCPNCGFGASKVPNAGALYMMLSDIAEALGETMPEGEDG